MKKFKVSRNLFLTFMFAMVVMAGMLIASVGEMGNAAYAAVTEMDCRFCLEGNNPDIYTAIKQFDINSPLL